MTAGRGDEVRVRRERTVDAQRARTRSRETSPRAVADGGGDDAADNTFNRVARRCRIGRAHADERATTVPGVARARVRPGLIAVPNFLPFFNLTSRFNPRCFNRCGIQIARMDRASGRRPASRFITSDRSHADDYAVRIYFLSLFSSSGGTTRPVPDTDPERKPKGLARLLLLFLFRGHIFFIIPKS